MKKALNAWSVNGNDSFAEMFENVKAAGFAAIELNLDNVGHSAHSLTMETTKEELESLIRVIREEILPRKR